MHRVGTRVPRAVGGVRQASPPHRTEAVKAGAVRLGNGLRRRGAELLRRRDDTTMLTTLEDTLLLCAAVAPCGSVSAQLTDITEAPNPLNAGIQKSLERGPDWNGSDGGYRHPGLVPVHYRPRSVPRDPPGTPVVPAKVHVPSCLARASMMASISHNLTRLAMA